MARYSLTTTPRPPHTHSFPLPNLYGQVVWNVRKNVRDVKGSNATRNGDGEYEDSEDEESPDCFLLSLSFSSAGFQTGTHKMVLSVLGLSEASLIETIGNPPQNFSECDEEHGGFVPSSCARCAVYKLMRKCF